MNATAPEPLPLRLTAHGPVELRVGARVIARYFLIQLASSSTGTTLLVPEN
jgi:hypothetical protein